jgi:hypothetical protein
MGWTSRRGLLLLTFAVVAAATAGTLTARWRSQTPFRTSEQQPVSLYIDPKYLDFGEVWETDRFQWRVPVHNVGMESVHILAKSRSSSCAQDLDPEILLPGQCRELRFEFDLRPVCAAQEHRSLRAVELPLPIAIATRTHRQAWVLRGRVRSTLIVPTKLIDLGRAVVTSAPRCREIPIRALAEVRELLVAFDERFVYADFEAIDASNWNFRVKPAWGLSVGRYDTAVELKPILTSGEAAPSIRIPVEFELIGDVQPDSPIVALGAHPVGSTVESGVSIRSFSGRSFTFDGWSVVPPGDCEVIPIGSGTSTHQFTIRQRVTQSGDHDCWLTFTGRDADGHPFTLAMAIRYYGLSASN